MSIQAVELLECEYVLAASRCITYVGSKLRLRHSPSHFLFLSRHISRIRLVLGHMKTLENTTQVHYVVSLVPLEDAITLLIT